MKKKIFSYLLITFIYLVPFKIAVITPSASFAVNLLCMFATVIGTLIFIVVSNSDDKHKSDKINAEKPQANIEFKNAA